MEDEINYISKATMRVNSVPNWGHRSEISFDGRNKEDFEVRSGLLEKLVNFSHDNEFNQSRVIGARHGSLLTVTNKNRWTLDLIAKSFNQSKFPQLKVTAPKVIELLIEAFTNKNLTPMILKKDSDLDEYGPSIFLAIRGLMIPFYCFTEHSINDESKPEIVLDTFKNHELKDLFLPEITFHPISIIRTLFLAITKPEYLDLTDEITLHELNIIYGKSFQELVLESSSEKQALEAVRKLVEQDLDISAIIERTLNFLNEAKNPDKSSDSHDNETKIFERLQRRFTYLNGLAHQLNDSHIQEIELHHQILKEVIARAGYVNSYLMTRIDDLKKDMEQKANELPSAFKKDGPDIVESE